jgi:hypothetical protein
MTIAYSRTATSLSVVLDFRSHVIPSSHPNFSQLIELVKNPATTEADIKPLMDIPSAIVNFTGGEITVSNGRLFYRGSEVKTNLATIILGFIKAGDAAAAEPFKKFLSNCRQNPDLALVDTIYDWCVKGNLPITPDGELIAWKIVGRDYQSLHSGKRGRLDHSIGKTVSEPREECDPNRDRTCSRGIHFCSIEYLQGGGYGGGLGGGNRVIAVVINPADVTAIPTDYNLTKGRCCKLRVVGEVEGLRAPDFYGSSKVYSGWEVPKAAPAPAKSIAQQFDLRNGDVVLTHGGDRVAVTKSDGGICVTTDWVHVKTGVCQGGAVVGQPLKRDSQPQDVVRIISRAPVTPRNASGIAKGQVWAKRNGSQVTIASISGAAGYPVKDDQGSVYTAAGRFNSDHSVSQLDLVRLVKDVN